MTTTKKTTRSFKAKFTRDIIALVKAHILSNIQKMPEEWDGMELREYIADAFHDERYMSTQRNKKTGLYKKRLRAYRCVVNTCL